MKRNYRRLWYLTGIFLGLGSIAAHRMMPEHLIEQFYGQRIFPLISWTIDHTISRFPFAAFYLLLILALLTLYFLIKSLVKTFRSKPWRAGRLLMSIAGILGYVVFGFYLLWGFNYDRVQLHDRLSWEAISIEKDNLIEEGWHQIDELKSFENPVDWRGSKEDYHFLEVVIRNRVVEMADRLGYLGRERVRCRQLVPEGILLRISTAGFYNPFTGECNIDGGLHPLQKPFVIAHEFFHGMGVTGEGDCNFLAYLICHQSADEFVRYSGELSYWRYLQYSLRRTDPEVFKKMWDALPDQVINDLQAIDAQMRKYPDIMPRFRDMIYSAYLKSNKIHDGMANYSKIVRLTMSWRANNKEL